MSKYLSIFLNSIILATLTIGLSACTTPGMPAQTPSSTAPLSTPTPRPPTATPVPLAAIVNDEPISLKIYQSELDRYKAALGTELASEGSEQQILDDLINQVLLAQGAAEAGFEVDDAMLQSRMEALAKELGDQAALEKWMVQYGYTLESFQIDLRRAIAAAWMRDQILSQTPTSAEQVHGRQILLYNENKAQEVLAQLKNGSDFNALAAQYDPVTYGDLGWFPKGFLLDAGLDEAVFKLQPGEYSPVIQTSAGYHIVLVIERDAQRPLEPDAYQRLQRLALQDWLASRRVASQVEILLP